MSLKDVFVDLRMTFAGGFDRPSDLVWFVAVALLAPLALVTLGGSQSNNLPWYFWATIMGSLIIGTLIAFLRFARRTHEGDISISPDRRSSK